MVAAAAVTLRRPNPLNRNQRRPTGVVEEKILRLYHHPRLRHRLHPRLRLHRPVLHPSRLFAQAIQGSEGNW